MKKEISEFRKDEKVVQSIIINTPDLITSAKAITAHFHNKPSEPIRTGLHPIELKQALDWFNSARWNEKIPEVRTIRTVLSTAQPEIVLVSGAPKKEEEVEKVAEFIAGMGVDSTYKAEQIVEYMHGNVRALIKHIMMLSYQYGDSPEEEPKAVTDIYNSALRTLASKCTEVYGNTIEGTVSGKMKKKFDHIHFEVEEIVEGEKVTSKISNRKYIEFRKNKDDLIQAKNVLRDIQNGSTIVGATFDCRLPELILGEFSLLGYDWSYVREPYEKETKTVIVKRESISPPTPERKAMDAIEKERFEQVDKHHFDTDHDSNYQNEELIQAALFCLEPHRESWPQNWDLEYKIKIVLKDRRDQIITAGALLLAHDEAIGGDLFENQLKKIVQMLVPYYQN